MTTYDSSFEWSCQWNSWLVGFTWQAWTDKTGTAYRNRVIHFGPISLCWQCWREVIP